MRRATLESFVAGGAFVAALSTLLVFAGALLGLWLAPHPALGLIGAISAGVAAWLAHKAVISAWFRAGALIAGVVAIPAELVTQSPGVGALQLVTVIVAIAVALIGSTMLKPLTRRVPAWLVGLGAVAVGFTLVQIVVGGGHLGHDEAAYALKARAWLEGTPDTGWSIHRGIGQSVIAAAVLPFSHSSEALRGVSVVLSLATVVAVWGLGRAIRSNRVGLAAAAIFAVAPTFLRRGAEFLTDVASTGLLLVVATLLWRWGTEDEHRAGYLYAAVVVAVLAFYVRYQSVLTIALLTVATAIMAWPRVRHHLRTVARAAGLGVALLLPHFVYAVRATGTPWGVITNTAEAGGRAFLGQGLVDYARYFPDLLAGQLGAVAIVVAVGWFVWSMIGDGPRRPALFLIIPAVGQFLALGLISHGDPRFVFFPVAFFAVAAGLAADDLRRRMPASLYRAGVAAFVVAAGASLVIHGLRFDSYAEARADSFDALARAARVVNDRSAGIGCGIVTGMQPQMTWLSGCVTTNYDLNEVRIDLDPDLERFLVLSEGGPREPEGALEEAYVAGAEGPPVLIDGSGSTGDVQVWRLGD